MKEPKRARRRRDLARRKAKARWLTRVIGGNWTFCYNHLCICSGPCCGNPRRWFGEPTMQERRHLEAHRHFLAEEV